MMDTSGIRKNLQGLSVRAAQLQGMLAADQAQFESIHNDVALAKGRNDLADEVGRVFDALQLRANQRSVGGFEQLLSAVLNDVLPEEGQVRLLTQYKNNSTYLDIALEKNGGLEDIVDGNGGAVTNVVCAGLRFAALSRTGNRRLMVLDEPDCWLKPERVPAFVNVIAQVSRDMQAQSFFITHHDPAMLEGRVNLVRFFADDTGKVHAQALAPLAQNWNDSLEPGVRAIELINVRRHEHTVVPCFPGATAFIGDNNLGKSTAISTAFKAVAYGESDDSLIRHGTTEAKIVMHLEGNQRLEWSRALKRSPAVIYSLYKDDELIAEGRPKTRNQAPEWVTDVLNICRVDDLDLQVGNQKSPVFLLNDSAPRRAQILSVGRESSHLKTYMKSYEEVKASDRETIKLGELGLARLKAKLRYLEKAAPLPETLEQLTQKGEAILSELEKREKLQGLEARIEQSTLALSGFELELKALNRIPEIPVLRDVNKLGEVTHRIESGTPFLAYPELARLPDAPVLQDVSAVLAMGKRLAEIQGILKSAPDSLAQVPEVPPLSDVLKLERIIELIAERSKAEKMAVELEVSTNLEFATAASELTKIQTDLGGVCPLCDNAFNSEFESNLHAHAH
jgi:hypothetical protein